MAEFQKELENWFIQMGYPIDQAKQTDWKTVCCGRMPLYWKQLMARNKPKHQVQNILKNIALQNIKRYMQYKHCSATEIGTITAPPQIQYPMEQLKLQKKLDNVKVQITTEKLAFENITAERKQKCVDLQKTKDDIIKMERKIYLMKEAIKKINNDICKYEKTNRLSENYNSQFISLKDEPVGAKSNKTFSDCDSSPDTPLFREILSKSELKTAELCDLIVKYHTNISESLSSQLSDNKLHNSKSKNLGHNLPLKDGLTKMQLFHCHLVIAIKILQKECKNAEDACTTIKENILNQLPSGKVTKDIFIDEYSKIYCALYEEAFRNEVKALRNESYLEEINELSSLKLANIHRNIFNDIANVKEKHSETFSKIKKKLIDASVVLEKISETNSVVKSTLCEIKNSKMDKVLWHPDFKMLQDEYLKIVLKKPTLLNYQSNNPFGFFSYLLTIIAEYNMNQKLVANNETLKKEAEWLGKTCAIPTKTTMNNTQCDEKADFVELLNGNPLLKLQPYHNVIFLLIRILKYKTSLENIQKSFIDCNEMRPEDILGVYMDIDLRELEKDSFSDVIKHLKKNPNFSKVNAIFNDFNETFDFFNDMNKSLNNS